MSYKKTKKAFRRLRAEVVRATRHTSFYYWLYPSWWHCKFRSTPKRNQQEVAYVTATPHPGAGIGHQMANWIAGFWFSQKLMLEHAHTPFSSQKWEQLLGFYNGSKSVMDLTARGYKLISLPLFDESNKVEFDAIQKIIDSYKNEKVVFKFEQDQFYADQFGVIEQIKERFYNAKARSLDQLKFEDEFYNIAIHIRRGDIVQGGNNKSDNITMRWLDVDYYINLLTQILPKMASNTPVKIWLFSQGSVSDFSQFIQFDNVEYCFDMSAEASFLHMVYADMLITSKSSFSYKPALLSNGVKICPQNFWHGYPSNNDWILAGDEGNISNEALRNLTI